MQRCPYLYEMKERLLQDRGAEQPLIVPPQQEREMSRELMDSHRDIRDAPVGTVVKLNSDGYGSHTSLNRHPTDHCHANAEFECHHTCPHEGFFPKNAKQHGRSDATPEQNNSANREAEAKKDKKGQGKDPNHPKRTSLFVIMSFIYAKLLVVICIAYVISEVVTHNIPLYYYEGFFTYLYGMSILFLLYVFCFLLQESACCNGGSTPKAKNPKPVKQKKAKKEKQPKKEKEPKEKKDKKDKKDKGKEDKGKEDTKPPPAPAPPQPQGQGALSEMYPKKMKDKLRERQRFLTEDPNNQFELCDCHAEGVLKNLKKPEGKDMNLNEGDNAPPPPPPASDKLQQERDVDLEIGYLTKVRKRKTSQNDSSHGSFFLRVGAIAFGLGTMIYTGLEFGAFFEIPFNSPCHQILRGVNPLLQMIFTFMQMYFIFMNARLNIHRFKLIARFGLMHIVATNLCVWIRTLILESLKEITLYHQRNFAAGFDNAEKGLLQESIRQHTLRNAGTVLGTHLLRPDPGTTTAPTPSTTLRTLAGFGSRSQRFTQAVAKDGSKLLNNFLRTKTGDGRKVPSPRSVVYATEFLASSQSSSSSISSMAGHAMLNMAGLFSGNAAFKLSACRQFFSELSFSFGFKRILSTVATPGVPFKATFPTAPTTTITTAPATTISTPATSAILEGFKQFKQPPPSLMRMLYSEMANATTTTTTTTTAESPAANLFNNSPLMTPTNGTLGDIPFGGYLPSPQMLVGGEGSDNLTFCGRVNIMGTIVQDSAPYLFPFIIEYSLIGAAVIYIMWRHIGRLPRYVVEEDLERRLEVMLSHRAVALARAQHGRVDCVGASKGLFFGLLLLVGSLICLILFFVLIQHNRLELLAIYLADASHCALMILSVFAIIIGFIRVQSLKFKTDEQNFLNDILLRVSAFGLFVYAVFSVIAGALNAFTHEPNLLVMCTGAIAILQVVMQMMFIADVSRRRVHLPEHDRTKPGRQIVTFLLICNVTMWIIYTFEAQKVIANPVQLDFYGFLAWSLIQRITLPLCIFHRFHSAVTLAEIWKNTYKARLE